MTTGKGLRQQDHVWLDAPVLDCEEASGPTKASLNLIGDEQASVFVAMLLGAEACD
jgi:hypothetical protein